MAPSLYLVDVTFIGGKYLKNVNWRHGTLKAYGAVWADPNHKCFTRVDPEGGSSPSWDQTLRVVLPPGTAVEDAMLHFDVVHAGSEYGTKPLIGSATLRLRDVLEDDYGYGGGWRASEQSLQLKRPSGRPQGKVDVKLAVKEMRYWAPPTAYGVPRPPASRNSTALPPSYGQEEKSERMWMGIAVGAAAGVAGVLTGFALIKGVDYVVGKITDVAEKLEELRTSDDPYDLAYEDTSEESSEDYSEESSEDEDNPVSEIDVAHEDDGGDNVDGDDN